MSAFTSKIKAETEGKTQKIQNSSTAVTTGIYRGVAGCAAQNYQIIFYPRKLNCSICYVKK